VRGPFDIADRMLQVSSPTLKPSSIASRPSSPSIVSPTQAYATGRMISDNKIFNNVKQRSPIHDMSREYTYYSSGIRNSNIGGGGGGNDGNNDHLNSTLAGRSGILLNKERDDLCWDHLFMVCGGTGITPMLQLVSFKNV